MTTIYPCFACEAEFPTFDEVESHITANHSAEVLKDTRRVFEYLGKKISESAEIRDIAFVPARYLLGKSQNIKIYSGYSPDDKAFYMKVGLDTKVGMVQGLGYKLFAKTEKAFILVKKR